MEFPASAGPFSWILNSYARHVDAEAAMVFICHGCRRPRRTPWWVQALIALAAFAVLAAAGFWLWQQGLFSGWLAPLGS